MDDQKQNGQPKRRRVLRAKDVMPPFDTGREAEDKKVRTGKDRSALSSSDGPTFSASHLPADPIPQDDRADLGEAAGLRPADGAEIPTYDLAENILAEQRRAAGRRRRAPGQVQEEPGTGPGEAGVRMFIPEVASQDLLELQRLVAEIVARDIDRLCRRPAG